MFTLAPNDDECDYEALTLQFQEKSSSFLMASSELKSKNLYNASNKASFCPESCIFTSPCLLKLAGQSLLVRRPQRNENSMSREVLAVVPMDVSIVRDEKNFLANSLCEESLSEILFYNNNISYEKRDEFCYSNNIEDTVIPDYDLHKRISPVQHRVNSTFELKQNSASNECSCTNFDFFCSLCGIPFLLPHAIAGRSINAKIRVRSIHRSRTRRRRASRRTSSHKIRNCKNMKHLGGGRSFSAIPETQTTLPSLSFHGSLVTGVMQESHERREGHMIRTVRDGISSQKVVYSCHFCTYRTNFKGMSAKIAVSRQQKSRRQAHACLQRNEIVSTGNEISRPTQLSRLTSSELIPAQFKSYNPAFTGKSGSICLDNKSKQGDPKKSCALKPTRLGPAKIGKSVLLDFLSSLNDA